ncbi:uncharacterized protein LOC129947466 [Eupeodes corollae]|uniref:uncharacterized protein LOC129947466 n=1 Tax=Eupeodes corollae TaxID=290404 RepID=UPI00249259B3|nr:uncharacterized protein LOC129947466 [Eupeodes corollae]
MKITLLFFVIASLVALLSARDIPKDDSLGYEIVDPSTIVIREPRPKKPSPEVIAQSNTNKTFAYDPVDKVWTVVKPTDEIKEGTLLWNQKDDKWLTQSFLP